MSVPPPHALDEATISVANDPEAIRLAEAQVVQAIERHNYPKASLFAIRLSLHEAMSNAFRHGHSKLPSHTPLNLFYKVEHDRILLAVEDQGPGFNPGEVPDPTLDENLERGSGRGLLLIRSYMASAQYNQKGNRLEMVYKRPAVGVIARPQLPARGFPYIPRPPQPGCYGHQLGIF